MTVTELDDTNFNRVLCVVAHPDDMEYGLSACVAKWVERGATVKYLLLTSGEAGMQRPPEVTGPLRAKEQAAACAEVGVDELEILDHPDGALMYSLELRREVARRIREFRPDTVVTMSWDIEVGWGLNQADHRVAGLVTLDAIRDAGNQWAFPELAEAGLEAWSTSTFVVSGDREPNHVIAIEERHVQAGVRSLAAHAEYLADLGDDYPTAEEFLPPMLAAQGALIGIDHGLAVRVHPMG